MPTLLISHYVRQKFGDAIERANAESGGNLDLVVLPEDSDARLSDDACRGIDWAFYSIDTFPVWARSFFSAIRRARNLVWLQVPGAGIDHPVFGEMFDRGVAITNARGSAAEPIAQTAIGGMLQLARPFLHWHDAQRRREWDRIEDNDGPPDLQGQTLVVIGVGAIGGAIARIARAIGLHVIGVRRSPLADGDPVDEMRHPSQLPEVLPRADWLAIASPLTAETRGLIGAEQLALLPRGARILNVGRGEILDEDALIQALRSGHLGGAYLDVFEVEPLPPESPLWSLPNVIVTPHNSAAGRGNEGRTAELFVRNLRRALAGTPLQQLENVVTER